MGYKIGRVYRITKNDDPTINYVGSTFSQLKVRWRSHKSKAGNNNSCCIGEYLDKYGVDNFKIILIKEYLVYAENQKDTKHLRAYEQLWINKFTLKKCCINKKYSCNLLKKERHNERNKLYEHNNKDKVLLSRKKYYQKNKQEKKKKRKEFYKNNKSIVLEKMKEKVECPICQCVITKQYLKKHQKTMKCINASK
jgi:hypothetical protein